MSRHLAPLILLALAACVEPPEDDKSTEETGETGEGEGEGEGEQDDCPLLTLSAFSVNVANAAAGATNTGTLTISNDCTGEFPLVLTPSMGAGSSETFSVPTDRITIPPGTSQDLVITFVPPDFEVYAATVVLSSNDTINPEVEVPVWGQAVADADGDGFDSYAASGSDCDDSDATTYPGADDDWYDGVDSDCAGDSDYDKDLDGYDSEDYGGDDCDDDDDEVFPGADDDWYDGVDGDCAGNSDYDRDGDGQDAERGRGPDCDDTDPEIYLGADETPYDGVDGDCDGASDYDADLDGYDSEDYGGDDCDDDDEDVNPTATDGWDDFDSDCDGLLDEDGVSVGEILVTEVMTDPSTCNDANGEWFEIYNDSRMDIDLYGWQFSAEDGGAFEIDEHLVFAPGEFLVFGASADTTKNCGLEPDFVYDRDSFKLENTRDTIALGVEGRVIIDIEYRSTWGMDTGYATQLDPDRFDDAHVDTADYWCAASQTYGDGDEYGTPGGENDQCAGA